MVNGFTVSYAKVEVVTQPLVVVSALGSGEVPLSQLGVVIKHYGSGDDEHGTPITVYGAYLDDIQKRKTDGYEAFVANFSLPMVIR